MRRRLLFAAVLLAASTLGAGELYEWTDEKGQVHWTDDITRIPPRYRPDAVERDLPEDSIQTYASPAKPSPAAGEALPEPEAARVHRIRIERAGLEIHVGATLNSRFQGVFKVDTGAAVNTIPAALVERLGIPINDDSRKIVIAGVAGQPMLVPVVRIRSVDVGGATVENVDAAVLDTMRVGLLGMPFFRNFNVNINSAEGLMTLEEVDLSQVEGLYGGYPEGYWRTSFAMVQAQFEHIAAYRQRTPEAFQDLHAQLDDAERYWKREHDRLEVEASRAGVPRAWRQ
jgi:hypothetical protein